MDYTLLAVLGFLVLFVLGILAMTGLKHFFRRLTLALIGFVVVFAAMFFGVGWATGGVPSLVDLPVNVQQPDFWMHNWIGLSLGLVLAGLSARVMLTRRV